MVIFRSKEPRHTYGQVIEGHESLGPRGGPPDYEGPIHPAYSAVKQQQAKNGNDNFYDTIIARQHTSNIRAQNPALRSRAGAIACLLSCRCTLCCFFEIRILRVLTNVTL